MALPARAPPRPREPRPGRAAPLARRFAALWQAAGGFRIAPAASLAEQIGAAVADGRLAPSRARTLAGYLLLGGAGVPQGVAWEPGVREACAESDDALDAVLCALIARAAALGLTEPPPPDGLEPARVEGWIHLPRSGSLAQLSHDPRS
jgi:hypothetical protein